MNYTIKEFIESNKFPKMQLISDNSGINRVIRGVQILSVPNMEKFLGGGELLLTSLVVYENQLNERIVLTHLEELNKKQVSGLIIAEDNEKFVPNILTQYEYIRQKRENIERKYHRDLEYRMLNGSLSEAEEDDVANLLNLDATEEYRVITFYLKPEMCAGNFSADQRKETEIVEKTILNVVPKEYIYCNTNRVIYIHKENKKEEKLECYLNQKQSIRKTSELMNIHARTVSYRLQKIVKLTGMNFDNIAEMLAVRNGIIILKILEQL